MILSPVYPSLAAIGETNQYGVVIVDDSSILTTYTDTMDLKNVDQDGFVWVNPETQSGAEEVPANVDPVAPVPESNVRMYTVVEHDDIYKIANKVGVAAEIILWSNNLTTRDTLVEGQQLKVPPISGIVHTLKSNETVSDIAKKYNVSVDAILEINNISDARKIKNGTQLMIPGAKLPEPVVEKKAETKKETTTKTDSSTQKTTTTTTKTATPAAKPAEKAASSAPAVTSGTVNAATGLKDRYAIKFTGLGRGFVAGNCTWHVARNKTVTWRGNANQWIRNARAQGVPTGKTPVVGAIVQFSGYGYSPQYGHVGIVTDIQDGNIIVSDMNYAGLYKITVRKVAINHPAIDGYIYVD